MLNKYIADANNIEAMPSTTIGAPTPLLTKIKLNEAHAITIIA
jgi:hypothetical protein